MRLPSEIAAEIRAHPEAPPSARLRNELAGSIHQLVLRVLHKSCVRAGAQADADDAAQELALRLYERIVAGKIPPEPGREDPYLQRSARNKANDILKGKGPTFRHRRHQALSPDEFGHDDPLARREAEALAQSHLAIVREELGSMRETYREVIEAYDLRGVPLTEIAEQWFAQGRAETRAKARQNVQKAHSLAIKRLRVLVAKRLEEER